jgi:hypothetical protein
MEEDCSDGDSSLRGYWKKSAEGKKKKREKEKKKKKKEKKDRNQSTNKTLCIIPILRLTTC